MCRHLEAGERVVGAEALHGGITAEVRRLTVETPGCGTRELVLRSYVKPFFVERAADSLGREAGALRLLAGTGVPAPELVGVDPGAEQCEYPSLLMTHRPGRTVLDEDEDQDADQDEDQDEGGDGNGDEGGALETRVALLAAQLVAIHAVRPLERPPTYEALTTADTVVVPPGGDAAAWAAAIGLIRHPAPPYEGRFLHRDFQPGNVLFDVPPTAPTRARITGVVDWAGASWGPTDLDVAHCCTNLALLHGPQWGARFAAAYEKAGGVLAGAADERRYWRVRDALAFSEEVAVVARPWQEAGRTELTTRLVAERLDAYVTGLMDGDATA
ncbi:MULTISPECIES: phosphotransferase family protein [unclassified Streptomyces]|uniref:phosphotransferase family protein n=1 Tax=unclassified Streptomyces TaxID=2593676 RepID=UPI00278C5194|nr:MULTISPECIES: aminoglycoside phosphotransferase family protein [unclassified Streptomyces]